MILIIFIIIHHSRWWSSLYLCMASVDRTLTNHTNSLYLGFMMLSLSFPIQVDSWFFIMTAIVLDTDKFYQPLFSLYDVIIFIANPSRFMIIIITLVTDAWRLCQQDRTIRFSGVSIFIINANTQSLSSLCTEAWRLCQQDRTMRESVVGQQIFSIALRLVSTHVKMQIQVQI